MCQNFPPPLPRCSSRRRRPPVRSSSRCPPTSGSSALGEAAHGRTALLEAEAEAEGATPAVRHDAQRQRPCDHVHSTAYRFEWWLPGFWVCISLIYGWRCTVSLGSHTNTHTRKQHATRTHRHSKSNGAKVHTRRRASQSTVSPRRVADSRAGTFAVATAYKVLVMCLR